MTDDEIAAFRRELGHAVIELQNNNAGYDPAELLPELVCSLVSLAAFISTNGAGIERPQFERLCRVVIAHEWSRDGETLQ